MKRRTILSSRKKPSQPSLIPQKQPKAPTLLDHTSKIQQKLQRLRQQINQKKKQSASSPMVSTPSTKNISLNRTKERLKTNSTSNANANANLHINNHISRQQREDVGAQRASQKADDKMIGFLKGIGMENYEGMLVDNGVDSFQILAEIKQKELEEIGVAKGHALKIIVSLRKLLESRAANKKTLLSQKQETKIALSTNTQSSSSTSNKIKKPKQEQKQQALQIIMQTDNAQEQQNVVGKRRYFCLYCYQVSDDQFCTQQCQEMYHKMFEKYENNLAKVQDLFGSKLDQMAQQQSQIDENQFISDIAFLDAVQTDNHELSYDTELLNQQTYNQALEMIRGTMAEDRQDKMQILMQQKQQMQQRGEQIIQYNQSEDSYTIDQQ